MKTIEEVMQIAGSKKAGAFMHVVYAHEVNLGKANADMGTLVSVASMVGRTGCEWRNTKAYKAKAQERDGSEPTRKGPNMPVIVKNRFYQGKEGTLFRFYPVHVKATYYLNGVEIDKQELLKTIPESKFGKATGIMTLKLANIIEIK